VAGVSIRFFTLYVCYKFKPGLQDTSTFFKINSDIAIKGLPLESAAGIKMDSTSKSHVPKNQLLPLLVPPQTQVFLMSTGTVNTVAKYFLNEGQLSVSFVGKQERISLPSSQGFSINVRSFRRVSTAYFGNLADGYLLSQMGESVLILVPSNEKWRSLETIGVIVSDHHNTQNNDASTQILTFPSAEAASKIFTMVLQMYFCFLDVST
jgi:hypothetical protein